MQIHKHILTSTTVLEAIQNIHVQITLQILQYRLAYATTSVCNTQKKILRRHSMLPGSLLSNCKLV